MIDFRIRLQNILVVFALIFFAFNSISSAQTLSPFKDSAFGHPQVQRSADGGDFQQIYYDEMTHVNGRDEIPVSKALDSRVSVIESRYIRNTRIEGLSTHQVGNLSSADFIVVFIHGAGGNKDLGFDDWSFGGNFNRLKNLALYNNGAYLSPTVNLNSNNAASSVARMISKLKRNNSRAKIVVSCGSAGGAVCWGLASNQSYSDMVSGLIFLGTAVDMPSLNIPYIKSQKPIVFAHGSRDPVLAWRSLYSSFEQVKTRTHAQYFLYNGGIHGTPIRMIDWRESLNWIFRN